MRADLPWAVMPPEAAVIFVREHGKALRDLEDRARIFALGGNRAAAQALSLFVAQARHSARCWAEDQRMQRSEVDSQAEIGRSELPIERRPSESETLDGGSTGLTTGRVAEQLGVSQRRVVQMIGNQLSAIRTRGRWVIDEMSVAEEIERRRNR